MAPLSNLVPVIRSSSMLSKFHIMWIKFLTLCSETLFLSSTQPAPLTFSFYCFFFRLSQARSRSISFGHLTDSYYTRS